MKLAPASCLFTLLTLPLVACNSPTQNSPAPDGASSAEEVATPAEETRAPGTPLVFAAQEGWREEEPTSSMRVTQYVLPAGSGGADDAQLVVYYFGNRAGTLEANIARWATQFEQPDGADSMDKLERSSRTVRGMDVALVDLSGTYRAETQPGSGERVNKPDYRMLAAVVESDHGPYYCKLVGPVGTVAKWEDSFQRFVGAIR